MNTISTCEKGHHYHVGWDYGCPTCTPPVVQALMQAYGSLKLANRRVVELEQAAAKEHIDLKQWFDSTGSSTGEVAP